MMCSAEFLSPTTFTSSYTRRNGEPSRLVARSKLHLNQKIQGPVAHISRGPYLPSVGRCGAFAFGLSHPTVTHALSHLPPIARIIAARRGICVSCLGPRPLRGI